MAKLTCGKCGNIWDGRIYPICPKCIVQVCETTPNFIRPKHDPRNLPNYFSDYRSVVTYDFITNQPQYINEIVYSGEFYYDTHYGNFTSFIHQPLGMTSGSGIPPNYPWPTHPLDSQKVVNVNGYPHVYAVDFTDVQHEIAIGRLIPPRHCDVKGCDNLAIPGTTKCSRH